MYVVQIVQSTNGVHVIVTPKLLNISEYSICIWSKMTKFIDDITFKII